METHQAQAQCWSEARDLLCQLGSRDKTQISHRQRTNLYRLAFTLVAMGVWVDRYGLPQRTVEDADWAT